MMFDWVVVVMVYDSLGCSDVLGWNLVSVG
jgi:hypothetical protein